MVQPIRNTRHNELLVTKHQDRGFNCGTPISRRFGTVADQGFPELRSTIDDHSVDAISRVLIIKEVIDDGHTKGDVGCRHKCGDDLPSLSSKIGYLIVRVQVLPQSQQFQSFLAVLSRMSNLLEGKLPLREGAECESFLRINVHQLYSRGGVLS
ncbi:uncharacterized protein K441DRAFT_672404 [Cenococcum geophilum 1.58]|uniref:uncharacterized protein n=1 Tax=Cenococcum geophilum 1.58 TaxID=794803 RepID=UPI00358EF7C0|nr:hypothetical protein K441DRAFT_672404 [Cenococcum geophilum 1.58]